jgi:hypothetical protein
MLVPELTDQGKHLTWPVEKVYRSFTVRVAHPGHKWGRLEVMLEGQPRRGRKSHYLEMSREDALLMANTLIELLVD